MPTHVPQDLELLQLVASDPAEAFTTIRFAQISKVYSQVKATHRHGTLPNV